MNAKDVGTIACPHCGRPAVVRQAQSRKARAPDARGGGQGGLAGALYVYCPDADGEPGCGAVIANGKTAQARIRARMASSTRAESEGTRPAVTADSAPPAVKPDPTPDPAPPKQPDKRKGLFGW